MSVSTEAFPRRLVTLLQNNQEGNFFQVKELFNLFSSVTAGSAVSSTCGVLHVSRNCCTT